MQYLSAKLPENPIIGLTRNPIDRVGLSSFLSNFHIASMYEGSTVDMLKQDGIRITTLHADPYVNNMAQLLMTDDFKHLVQMVKADTHPTYLLLTNITEKIEQITNTLGISIIANSSSIRSMFENKANIRDQYGNSLPFPEFRIIPKEELASDRELYNQLAQYHLPFVIQDESPSFAGGRGTFIVNSKEDYEAAVTYLLPRGGSRVAVSEYIVGENASIQGCVTSHGVFYGPLQTQLYDDPALVHRGEGASKFAGGMWGFNHFSKAAHQHAHAIIKKAGRILQEKGYKGIFGIDLMITPQDRVCMLEINARTTALTQPLTLMQEHHSLPPLLLLHILEHMKTPYEITDSRKYQEMLLNEPPFSFALLHNRSNKEVRLTGNLLPGVYRIDGDTYSYIAPGYLLSHLPPDSNHFIIPDVPQPDLPIPSKKSLLHIMTRDTVVTNKTVNSKWLSVIEWIESNFS